MASILVIDDTDTIRTMLRRALELAGYEVSEAGDGNEGLHIARQASFDLVFCDLFMPHKGGLETIRRLRRELPALPVIAMSGGGPSGMVELLRVAKGLGAVKIMEKPFGEQDVRDAVAEVLGAR